MKPEFASATIQAFNDESRSISANVNYSFPPENGCVERITVSIFIFDTDISVEQVEPMAIERANQLLKKAVSELE